jgi:hypothetical protein
MTVAKISFGVLQRVAEFLAALPEDQLADLAEGRARLAYVRDDDTEPAPRVRAATKRSPAAAAMSSEDTRALVATIEALGSREDAVVAVRGLTTPEIRAVGKALSIPNAAKNEAG